MLLNLECVVVTYAAMAASSSCLSGESSQLRPPDGEVISFDSECMPGGVMEHLLRISDRTVAHCTFLTTNGTIDVNSFLPSEWLRAHAQ